MSKVIIFSISINKIKLNSREFTLINISRRSVDRAGTRMFSRGADENGFASNFVETEQIVLFQSEQASFVQPGPNQSGPTQSPEQQSAVQHPARNEDKA